MLVLANFESVRPPHWLFGSRHSAAYLLAVTAALIVMIDAPRAMRVAAGLLVAASVAHGTVAAFRDPLPSGKGLTGAERTMVAWLNRQHPNATLLSTNAQSLSVYTSARFHWTDCAAPPQKTQLMLETLTIHFVIVYDGERSCAFAQGFVGRLPVEATFRDEIRAIQVFRVMRKMSRTGAPSLLHDAAG